MRLTLHDTLGETSKLCERGKSTKKRPAKAAVGTTCGSVSALNQQSWLLTGFWSRDGPFSQHALIFSFNMFFCCVSRVVHLFSARGGQHTVGLRFGDVINLSSLSLRQNCRKPPVCIAICAFIARDPDVRRCLSNVFSDFLTANRFSLRRIHMVRTLYVAFCCVSACGQRWCCSVSARTRRSRLRARVKATIIAVSYA